MDFSPPISPMTIMYSCGMRFTSFMIRINRSMRKIAMLPPPRADPHIGKLMMIMPKSKQFQRISFPEKNRHGVNPSAMTFSAHSKMNTDSTNKSRLSRTAFVESVS